MLEKSKKTESEERVEEKEKVERRKISGNKIQKRGRELKRKHSRKNATQNGRYRVKGISIRVISRYSLFL